MVELKLTIEPFYPIICDREIKAVVVIGCGGTGSFVVRDLARSISTMLKKPELLLIDGDTVEEKNLKRQNFIASDIARNKAEVLATRYAALGFAIGYKSQFLEKPEDLRKILDSYAGPVIIISCVDNAKTRAMIRGQYLTVRSYSNYWIDCGNEEFTGQAVLAVNVPGWNLDTLRAGVYPTPDVFDLYPELNELAKLDKLPTEMSCAELAVSSPQYGFINATAAIMAVNWAQDLLSRRPIKTHVVEFSTGNTYSHKSLTHSAVVSWGKFFAPIRICKIDSISKKKPLV